MRMQHKNAADKREREYMLASVYEVNGGFLIAVNLSDFLPNEVTLKD